MNPRLPLLLLLSIGCCGCLKDSSPELLTVVPEFDELPAAECEVVTLKPVSAETPVAESGADGYTGAVVHVSDDCEPCHWLLTDLRYLSAHHGWRVCEHSRLDPRADWVIANNSDGVRSFPLVEFFRDGEPVGESSGYVCSPDFEVRRDALRTLVRSHPRKQ